MPEYVNAKILVAVDATGRVCAMSVDPAKPLAEGVWEWIPGERRYILTAELALPEKHEPMTLDAKVTDA